MDVRSYFFVDQNVEYEYSYSYSSLIVVSDIKL